MEPIKEALTFDDVLLLPRYSETLPSEAIIKAELSKKIKAKRKVIDTPSTIIIPKSMTGFISLTINEAKATKVVNAV